MPSDTICLCSILNDFVTGQPEAFSNLAQMKAIKTLGLRGICSEILLRRLWKKYAGQ